MKGKAGEVLKSLLSTLGVARIYTVAHPKFRDSLDKVYLALSDLLGETKELVVGIVGGELATGEEIFFDLSKKVKKEIEQFEARNIERIVFSRGITKEELIKFISLLVKPLQEVEKDIQKNLLRMGVKNIVVGKIKVSPRQPQDDVMQSISYFKQYEDSLEKISYSVKTVLNREKIDHLELKFTVANAMENLVGRYGEFLKLGTVKRYDVITFAHLLNVSILAMYFSSKLKFIKDDILDIGMAALFHDIGKIYISQKIIKKGERLTEDEFMRIASHTNLGAEILLNYADTLGLLSGVVAFEHHLGYDQRGYPRLRFPQKPHIASLIVSICDVYDALLQRRTYKSDYSPDLVYNIMIREKGSFFEPQLLDEFFKIMGVWPKGTIVVLNDGRICVVIEVNEDDIFFPKVKVIVPQIERKIIDLREDKEKVKIERFLNPLGEGKKYSHLI